MAYQIHPAKPLGEEIARIICELLARGAGPAPRESLEERIHHGRTTCKKARAVLRLLRRRHPGFCRRENRRLRNAADSLAALRDAEAMLSAARHLQPQGQSERAGLHALRRRLRAHRQAAMADKKIVEQHLVAFTRELHASLTAVKGWHPADRGFAAVAPEIADTYRQARRLAKRMDDMAPGTEYHEWRKAVKTFGYHCRLLRGAWPEILKPLAKEVGRLGEVLGKEHDLTVLAGFASKRPENTLKATPSDKRTRKLIYRRRRELRGQARTIAQRIFVEKPRAYVDRMERWWKSAAKISGDEKPALGS